MNKNLRPRISVFLASFTQFISTVAIFANTASAIKFYGIRDYGILGHTWQALILIAALFNSIYWIKKISQQLDICIHHLVGIYRCVFWIEIFYKYHTASRSDGHRDFNSFIFFIVA